MSQIVNHVMQLRSVVDDMNRRLVALERSTAALAPAPAPAPVATPDSRTIEDVQVQLAADVRTEVRSAVAKEKMVIETTLGYKLEQSVSRLVKERVEQLRSDLEAATAAGQQQKQQQQQEATVAATAAAGQQQEAPPVPAPSAEPTTDGIVMKKKKSGGTKAAAAKTGA